MEDSLVISVVIPIFNGEMYIEQLIEELKAQTYTNFEAIFVDDGSSDGTAQKLDALSSLMTSIPFTIIHQENTGVSAARNKGLDIAVGKYICFLDADDRISPDYLERLVNAITETNCKVALGHICRDASEMLRRSDTATRKIVKEEFLREFLYHGIKYSLCAALFLKECFQEFALRFPEGYRYSEDIFVLWQFFARLDFIAVIPCAIYWYYDNPVSAMNKHMDLGRLGAVELMRKLEPTMKRYAGNFSTEFCRFAVARHHWSILWQAAGNFNTFRAFQTYCSHFSMGKELRKLLLYPEKRISWSSRIYCFSPRLYYYLMRGYLKIFRHK